MRMPQSLRLKVAYAAHAGTFLLYAACLLLPAFEILSPHADRSPYAGFAALALGVIGRPLTWLANPILFIAWFCLRPAKGVTAFVAATIALALALTFLTGGQLAAGSEGLYPYQVLSGYYVWQGSIVLAALAGFLYGGLNVTKAKSADTVPDQSVNSQNP